MMKMDTKTTIDQILDQAQRFSAFTGLRNPDPSDRFFLVMGMTGSGKSTFVSRCSGRDVNVGHGLYSCTDSIDVFDFQWKGRRIYLIDTPGFNDTDRSDIDTLGIFATYLGASHANGVRLHGIIMLHPITSNRMSGSTIRNIEMTKAMCGFKFYDNFAIATTMWPESSLNDEMTILENREAELVNEERFFGALISKGATYFRHNDKEPTSVLDEEASAQLIVSHLIEKSDKFIPEVLQLQREITEQRKSLGETTAGIILTGELYKARRAHEEELREIEKTLRGELAKANIANAANLQDLKDDIERLVKKSEEEKQSLRRTIQDMHEDEERRLKEKLEALDKDFRRQLRAKEEELRDMEFSLEEVRKDMARRKAFHQKQRIASEARRQRKKTTQARNRNQLAEKERRLLELETSFEKGWNDIHQKSSVISETKEQEAIVQSARKDVLQAQDAYKKFGSKKGELIKSSLGGVASGLASAMVAGEAPLITA
ncbi:hypothetical protein N7540_009230 [Penicillium herquei]|nr:hypothetical protein N7540_009230 [Penicillium herquei]